MAAAARTSSDADLGIGDADPVLSTVFPRLAEVCQVLVACQES